MYAGDGPVLVQNSDTINTVFIGDNAAIKATDQQGIAPLGPQASVVFDGNNDVFGTCGANQTVVIYLFPGGVYDSPPPAQVALAIADSGLALEATLQATNTTLGDPAQDPTVSGLNTGIPNNIAVTGAPLLNLSSAVANSGGASIAANGSLVVPASGAIAINQPSFEILAAPSYTTTNGATPFVFCVINWFNASTGLLVDKETFTLIAGNNSSLGKFPHRIKGPTRGDEFTVTFFNLDAAQAITVQYVILISSRVVQQEQIDLEVDWKENSGTIVNVPGFTVATRVLPDSNVLATFANSSLAANGTDLYLIPPHNGLAYFNLQETGVAGTNIGVSLSPVPTSIYGTTYLMNDIMGTGNPDKLNYPQILLGNGPTQLSIHNGGSVAANYAGMLTTL